MKQRHGNGLLVRLLARLSEIVRLAARLIPALSWTREEPDPKIPVNSPISQAVATLDHLVHCGMMQREVIKEHQILAPTEWNFHPEGWLPVRSPHCEVIRHQWSNSRACRLVTIAPSVGFKLNIAE